MKKDYQKKTPTYAQVIAAVLVGIMAFSAAAIAILAIIQHVH